MIDFHSIDSHSIQLENFINKSPTLACIRTHVYISRMSYVDFLDRLEAADPEPRVLAAAGAREHRK